MKYILLIVVILFICFSCAISSQEYWLEFEVPYKIQRLYDDGCLNSVEEIDKAVWNIYSYETYSGIRKAPKDVIRTKAGNCVDFAKLSAGLCYKLLNIKVDLAIVSKKKHWDHVTLYYNNNIYSQGKKDYYIEKIVLFELISYETFIGY